MHEEAKMLSWLRFLLYIPVAFFVALVLATCIHWFACECAKAGRSINPQTVAVVLWTIVLSEAAASYEPSLVVPFLVGSWPVILAHYRAAGKPRCRHDVLRLMSEACCLVLPRRERCLCSSGGNADVKGNERCGAIIGPCMADDG